MARCPRCGGNRFHYELRAAGTSAKSYYKKGRKNYKSKRHQKSVGICPDCGYTEEKYEKGCLFYILCIILFPIPLSIWFYKSNIIKLSRKYKCLILAIVWLALFALLVLSWTNRPNDDNTERENYLAWETEFTGLSSFDYIIEGDKIILGRYKGSEKKVNIAAIYNVEGHQMHVTAMNGTFALKRVESVIVPEGVTEIADNTFNSCGIESLYLPSSLRSFSGWSYLHNIETIYYGGTEEQWTSLVSTDESLPDAVQIFFNAGEKCYV